MAWNGVELRKLPPSFKLRLGQLLEPQEGWKKLMCSIPSEGDPTTPKYTAEHISLVENHGRKTGTPCGEILLDEWSTSGRRRPTPEILLNLLINAQLFRAADYVATEILGGEPPERPEIGPAAKVPSSLLYHRGGGGLGDENRETDGMIDDLQEVLERLNNYDYTQGNLVPFHISVLKKATNNFNQEKCIGNGAFGTVYKLDLSGHGGPLLATKLLHPTSSVVEDQFLTELRVLSEYRHENLLPLIGYCTNGPQYCLVYEFMKNGSLIDIIACQNDVPPLEWGRRVSIIFGIAKGLHCLHTSKGKPLIHRDIKSANILLTDTLMPKIGDFGLAKNLASSNQTSALTSTIFGTSAYMAPEAFRGDISPKMDIFSFGVIMLELLTGLPPFDENREDGNDIVTYLEEVVDDDDILPFLDEKAGEIMNQEECTSIYTLAKHCLDDKKRRPTSEQVLRTLRTLESLQFQEIK